MKSSIRSALVASLTMTAFASAPETDPDPGKWRLVNSTARSATLALDAEQAVEGWMDTVHPRLELDCRSGLPEAAIRLESPAHPDRDGRSQQVALRFDRDRLQTRRMALSADGQSLVFEYPATLIEELTEHATMLVRLTHLAETSVSVSFDLRGLDLALAPLRERCGSAFESPDEVMVAGRGGVESPVLIQESWVEPRYPAKAQREGVESQVVVRAVARLDGSVEEAEVVRCTFPDYGFEAAALEAVHQWRYEPARWQGKPVAARFYTLVYFNLPED